MDKLADIVDVSTSSEIEDLQEGISDRDQIARSRQAVVLLRDRLHNLEIALARRGWRLTVFNDLANACEETNYALDTLDAYFQSVEAGVPAPLELRGAHIFAVYVAYQFMDILFYAEELDASSNSSPR